MSTRPPVPFHETAQVSRRSATAALFTIVPAKVLGGQAGRAPSDKLNIAGVGVGAMGAGYVRECESENIVALCDVDEAFAAKTFARYPSAKTYRDFREMLDKQKDIDAVIIGTPDHTHAVVAMAAMDLGKHIYCAKPLTRTLYEARLLAATARKKRVATQMSVQSSASDDARLTEEWVKAGAVGAVREVHVWTDRPIWPQGLLRPREGMEVPKTLNWDLWLGPASERPYHTAYHPFSWRGWYDFGTGALGDMACHAFHVVFRALDLGQPHRVSASATRVVRHRLVNRDGQLAIRNAIIPLPETFPHSSAVTWDFATRGAAPPVRMHWYDGGVKPPIPADMPSGKTLPGSGTMYVGDKGTLVAGFAGGSHQLLPESRGKDFTPPAKTVPRSGGHYQEWIAASKGGPAATCEFSFGSLLTEVAILGTIAQRTQKSLDWDAQRMCFPNDPEASALLNPAYRKGWKL
ncbi:MAG: Gfo/Idh/MocA family oxidoreductase [Bryobacterales bacterium]|nr:Gfo/Idh/MocA family oxidoreductase [Bryobacterales bacterium]